MHMLHEFEWCVWLSRLLGQYLSEIWPCVHAWIRLSGASTVAASFVYSYSV